MTDVIVIGGGPAGMLAAVSASEAGADVLLLEKNEKLGKKLFITGKGRCNVTNSASQDLIIKNIVSNPKFMFSALKAYGNTDICEDIESQGIKLKEERGGRIFPVSDHSSDVIRALKNMLERANVSVKLGTAVKDISAEDGSFKLILNNGSSKECRALVIATGGVSYPSTGSTGDGYTFAKKTGHTVVTPVPSLVPLEIKENWCKELQGLSLKNTGLKMYSGSRPVFEDFGEMLFTHFGVSGPMVLSASSYYPVKKNDDCRIVLDLKPALTDEMLDERLIREFSEKHEKHFINVLPDLLPAKLVPVICSLSGISAHKKCGEVTKEERRKLVNILKNLEMHVSGTRGFDEAIITKGGISVKEVSPKDMMSKIVPGLFFAGEILDLDALTGGFNLQIAWSTGHAAGEGAAAYAMTDIH